MKRPTPTSRAKVQETYYEREGNIHIHVQYELYRYLLWNKEYRTFIETQHPSLEDLVPEVIHNPYVQQMMYRFGNRILQLYHQHCIAIRSELPYIPALGIPPSSRSQMISYSPSPLSPRIIASILSWDPAQKLSFDDSLHVLAGLPRLLLPALTLRMPSE